jgi:hypothetical protein
LFSPIRSGSSISVYAAGAGLGFPVADEVFGPWDRTGSPYGYPRSHLQLIKAFKRADETLTSDVVSVADGVFRDFTDLHRTDTLICKHPHASIAPARVGEFWPEHRCVVLLRNPLFALNSLFVRGWDEATGGGSMIKYFSTIARRWIADPHRLVYDQMQRDPAGYFARLFEAWGLDATAERLGAAVTYRAAHYHHSSKSMQGAKPGDSPTSVRSEQAWAVPEPIVTEYLADPLMREVFTQAGWSIERGAYPELT